MKIKKFTQKDRYGNTVSFDFELPEKPLDPNQVISKMMDMASNGVPPMMGDTIPTADPMTHPGEPMGTDTVPAWLTPGEFVVNKEAMDDPQNAAMVEAINDEGRMMQAAKGGMVPPIQMTGPIPMGYEQGGMIHPDQQQYNEDHAHHMIPEHMFLGGLIEKILNPEEYNTYIPQEMWDEMTPQQRDYEKTKRRVEQGWKPSRYVRAGVPNQQYEEQMKIWRQYSPDAPKVPEDNLVKQWLESQQEPAQAQYKFLGGLIDFFQDPTTPQKLGEAVPKIADTAQSVLPYIGFDTIDESNLDGYAPYGWNIQENRPYTKEEGIAAGTVAPDVPAPQSVPAGVPASITSPELQQAEVWERQYAGRDPDDLGTAPTGDGSVPPVEATPPAVETDPLTEKAIENLTTGRGLIGALIPPTEIQISEERERLAQAGRAAAAGELPDDLVETSANLQDEADALEAAANAIPPDTREYDDAVQRAAEAQEKADNAKAGEARIEVAQAEAAKDAGQTVNDAETQSIINNVLEGLGNDASDTGPASDQPGEDTPNSQVTATGEGGTKEQKSAAVEAIKGAFGDLFDSKELARMGILYLGSRLMGYSHAGSLRYAGQSYIQRVDAKAAAEDKFVKENIGNFTPASLKAYQDSGDPTDLVPVGATPEASGEFKTMYNEATGQRVRAQKYKVGDQTVWMYPDEETGELQQAGFAWTDDASSISGTNEWSQRVATDSAAYTSMIEQELGEGGGIIKGKDGSNVPLTNIRSKTQGRVVADWAIKNKVPPELMGGILQGAVADAIAHSTANPNARATDLTSYLNDRYVISLSGNPDAFKLANGKTMDVTEIAKVGKKASNIIRATTGDAYKGASDAVVQTIFFKAALQKWQDADQEYWTKQAKGSNKSPFFLFVENDLSPK